MPCSFRIISEVLPEILTRDKCDFLKPISNSFSNHLILCKNDNNYIHERVKTELWAYRSFEEIRTKRISHFYFQLKCILLQLVISISKASKKNGFAVTERTLVVPSRATFKYSNSVSSIRTFSHAAIDAQIMNRWF